MGSAAAIHRNINLAGSWFFRFVEQRSVVMYDRVAAAFI
jgi:hypothetical protein